MHSLEREVIANIGRRKKLIPFAGVSIARQAKVAGIFDDPIRSSDVEHENQFISLPNASSHRARNTKLEAP
jgi:hypothetical protein